MSQIDEYGFELVGWATAPYFVGHNPELWECPDCGAVVLTRAVTKHSVFHDNTNGYED